MEEEVIIEVTDLTKDYGYGRGVFDVTFKVKKGECYGYLGPNGAGKSTTIRHIMGFSNPQKGTVKVFGIDSFNNTDKILKKVGYLPGEIALPSGLSGREFLDMMAKLRDSKNEDRLNYLLDKFKLDPDIDTKLMSLGDKRKLAVVAAFMDDPEVLILDEPTSGLDPVMQETFIQFVIEEKKRGKTILLSSHIFSEVDATCDIISIIKDGKHVSSINAHDFKHRDNKAYIIAFDTKEEKAKFLKENKFEAEDFSPTEIEVKVNDKDISTLVAKLASYKVKEFVEHKFTLQDYFMDFYKEDKKFEGIHK